VSFTIPESASSRSIMNHVVDVEDDERGDTQAVTRAVSGNRVSAQVAAFSVVSALAAERTADPFTGTLEDCIEYYVGLCDVPNTIVVEGSIASTAVVALGWFAPVWDQLKKFCAAYQIEVALVGDEIRVRKPRQVRADRVQESQFNWSMDNTNLAKTVEAWFYPRTAITNALVLGRDMAPVSNLAASAVHTFEVQLDASLSSVQQPTVAASVSLDHSSSSTYAVVDAFDEPVSTTFWTNQGGRVSVEILEDTRGVRVTVVAPRDASRAPYRLAGVDSSGDDYSTLRIVGTGVSFTREKYVLPACMDDRATIEVGCEVDNEFFKSWGDAHLSLLHAVRRYGGGLKRISAEARDVTLTGASQVFGNVAGARVLEDLDEYRIRSVQFEPGGVSWDAESDTTVADVDAVWAGRTLGEWDAIWAGQPVGEFDLHPLTPVPAGSGSFVSPYPDAFYPDQAYPA
jgi:hypothetical protein